MVSDRLLLAVYFCVLFSMAVGAENSDLEPRALRDFYSKNYYPGSEKELLGALHEVLKKLQTKRLPTWEKKYGQGPQCNIGDMCAVRKGPRIWRTCNCLSSKCNYFLFKCV
ncbi:cocaine- and amphetamine-regulated transcript protein-like [Leucoraja erinacea]|uniref:CART n=1 Tax=Leucoraja ocellata TaxID=173042 RepID=C1J7W0_LEUOC|nr:cocaine- and amphetamine-regulated transcript protein-like [Leucoraja erinacea]ACO06235.1 CART [Leucoraja ocellata]